MHRRMIRILFLFFVAACSDPSAKRISTSEAVRLAPGTYHITVTERGLLRPARRAIQGVLVLNDTVLPTKALTWFRRPVNGCMDLRGDLDAIAVPRGPSVNADSIAGFTTWELDSKERFKLNVFQGADYGYWVTFTIDGQRLEGSGVYNGLGAFGGSNRTRWTGERIGGPDLQYCARAFQRDSVRAARSHR
jgi:hypothetical protein